VVDFLSGRSPAEAAGVVAAFRKGLSEIGFVEPQNVTIEFRWAEGQFDRLPALAKELVDRPVAVIAALGGSDTGAPMRKLKQPSLRLPHSTLPRSWSVPIRFSTLGASVWLRWHYSIECLRFISFANMRWLAA